MKLNFTKTPVDLIECDLLVIGCVEEERPLRGYAGLVDWRLHGLLSKHIREREFTCRLGEVMLIPMDRHMQCRWLLLCGLGSGLEVGPGNIRLLGEQAVLNARRLNIERFAIYHPHAFTRSLYKNIALKGLLEGISKEAATVADSKLIDDLVIIIPSTLEEDVDLSKVMVSKLLSRHTTPDPFRDHF